MKKEYVIPRIEVLMFENSDKVQTTSELNVSMSELLGE